MKPYRWVMLVLLWLLYITFGLVSRSIFPLVTPILADLELSYSQMGLILGSWQLTYIFAALVAGTILDRWGVRKSIFAGVMVIGLSASLRYFSGGFISMLIAVALFGLGGPMISIGGPKTISAWFHGRSRGTAMGIYTTGNWAGGLDGPGLDQQSGHAPGRQQLAAGICGLWRDDFFNRIAMVSVGQRRRVRRTSRKVRGYLTYSAISLKSEMSEFCCSWACCRLPSATVFRAGCRKY